MAKSEEGFDWLLLWSMFDNLHSPPPALVAELNWSFINMGMFAVPPAAPSPAPTWLLQGNAQPCREPLAGARAGRGCGKGPTSSSTPGRGHQSPTLWTCSSRRSQTPPRQWRWGGSSVSRLQKTWAGFGIAGTRFLQVTWRTTFSLAGLESEVFLLQELINSLGKNCLWRKTRKEWTMGAFQGRNTFLHPARVKHDQNLL